jgi:hypothetical protein
MSLRLWIEVGPMRLIGFILILMGVYFVFVMFIWRPLTEGRFVFDDVALAGTMIGFILIAIGMAIRQRGQPEPPE